MKYNLFPALIFICLLAAVVAAQTSAFTYQGRLTDANLPANGAYQFQFKLFDAAAGGTQTGATLSDVPATVTNGIFTVQLDFGALAFDGGARFLEIAVRQTGNPNYTTLSPRQAVASVPYSIRSQNAEVALTASNSQRLGGIQSSNFVQTTDTRLSDNRNPLAGSTNYIQNTQNALYFQPNTNFSIAGFGVVGGDFYANKITTGTEFWIGGGRILAAPVGMQNIFLGSEAGRDNTTGNENSFVGDGAGTLNTTGNFNSYFGSKAGQIGLTGNNNSFFGYLAGQKNTDSDNAFFGYKAGAFNTSGNRNSFFGKSSGESNADGNGNSFFGFHAGFGNTGGSFNAFFGNIAGAHNTTSSFNAFFGYSSGVNNTTGFYNTFIGNEAGASNTVEFKNSFFGANSNAVAGINNATAIGANAQVSQSNSLVLGSINGVNGATADTKIGIGTTTPNAKLHVAGGNLLVSGGNISVSSSGNRGIVLTAPNGSCYLITVGDAGNLITTISSCL
jgi:hypothetical protein